MQTRGAVIRQAPGKYEVVDLEVDDPGPGEIQVKMVASGMCHSDDHVATGDIPVGVYPFAGGHEGARVRTQFDQALRGEVLQRFAHRRARRAVARGEPVLVEPRARRQAPREDVVLDRAPDAVGERCRRAVSAGDFPRLPRRPQRAVPVA